MPSDLEPQLRRMLAAFNEHDLDAIMSAFADECVFETPRGPDRWGRRFVGKDEVRRGLAARFEGIPDVHYGDDDHFACAALCDAGFGLFFDALEAAHFNLEDIGDGLEEVLGGEGLAKDAARSCLHGK